MKGARFKGQFEGMPRTRLEPINPSPGMPKAYFYRYVVQINGHKFPWMGYCKFRWDWLIRSLVKHGVNVREFMPGSRRISRRTCQKVVRVLTRMRDDIEVMNDSYLKDDLAFWGHCGGVRIHDWAGYNEY